MTSNVEALRAAEAQLPLLQQQLKELRAESLADDGQIDAEEQAEIDRLQTKIDATQDLIAQTRQRWETNKTSFESTRAGFDAGLADVAGCTDPRLAKDQRALSDEIIALDAAAGVEDYATALDLTKGLDKRIADFISLIEQRAENARLAALTPEELAKEDLTTPDMEKVFSEEYMMDLKDTTFPTDGDPKAQESLGDLMDILAKGVTGEARSTAMDDLAALVGEPPSAADLDGDYGRFLVIRDQQETIGGDNNSGDVPDLDEDRHPDFQASRGQLLFGKALGDAFGIHEVFASLLSPTGGLVGPGNDFLPVEGVMDAMHLSPDNPVALHGTVHDAAGYLKAYHNEGPGYNYRDDPIEGAITSAVELLPNGLQNMILPLTGQLSGIAYWTGEVGEDFAQARLDEGLICLEKELSGARDAAASEIADLIATLEDAQQDVTDAAEVIEAEARAALEKQKQELADTASDFVEGVQDQVGQTQDRLADLVGAAGNQALDTAAALGDAVESVGDTAIEAVEHAAAGAGAMGEAAIEQLSAVASFIWS